jgi:hypothetical protein
MTGLRAISINLSAVRGDSELPRASQQEQPRTQHASNKEDGGEQRWPQARIRES